MQFLSFGIGGSGFWGFGFRCKGEGFGCHFHDKDPRKPRVEELL